MFQNPIQDQSSVSSSANVNSASQGHGSYGRNRWDGIGCPGALVALNYLSQHRRFKSGNVSEQFIPSSSEEEFIADIILSPDDKSKKPGLWEGGGAVDKYGAGIIVADAQGRPLVPFFSFVANGEYTNKRHSMLPISVGGLIALAAFAEGDALVLVFKCIEVTFDRERGIPLGRFSLVEAYEGNPGMVAPIYQSRLDSDLTETGPYRSMVQAVWTKANTYQCMHAQYVYPWRLWKSYTKPLPGQAPKAWEPQNGTPQLVLDKLSQTGLADPEPKTVYTSFDNLVRDLDLVTKATVARVMSGGRGPKIYVPFCITKDGENMRVTMHVYLSGIKGKDDNWVRNREPAIVKTFVYIAKPEDESAFYLNTHKGLAWNNIQESLSGQPDGSMVRLVYEYMGT